MKPDFDLAMSDFAHEYEDNPVLALDRLQQLLLDEDTCLERMAFLRALAGYKPSAPVTAPPGDQHDEALELICDEGLFTAAVHHPLDAEQLERIDRLIWESDALWAAHCRLVGGRARQVVDAGVAASGADSKTGEGEPDPGVNRPQGSNAGQRQRNQPRFPQKSKPRREVKPVLSEDTMGLYQFQWKARPAGETNRQEIAETRRPSEEEFDQMWQKILQLEQMVATLSQLGLVMPLELDSLLIFLPSHALAIVDFLRNPPRNLLVYILSEIAQDTLARTQPPPETGVLGKRARERAEQIIDGMFRSEVLQKDSKYALRVAINLAKVGKPPSVGDLEDRIWEAMHSFLAERESAKVEGNSEDLSEAWEEIRQLAETKGRHEIRLLCARRAWKYAPPSDRGVALYQVALSLHDKTEEPQWAEAASLYREAVEHFPKEEKRVERARILYWLGHCLSNQEPRDLAGAVECYQEAAALFNPSEEAEERCWLLVQWGFCLQEEADLQRAIRCYRETIETPVRPEQQFLHALARYRLALCLRQLPECRYEEVIENLRKAESLLTTPEGQVLRLRTLRELAECLEAKKGPEILAAAEVLREAVKVDLPPHQQAERIDALLELARCQGTTRDEAVKAYCDVLELLKPAEHSARWASVAYELAHVLQSEGRFHEAIARYLELRDLLKERGEPRIRADTLRQLASCYRLLKEPRYEDAIDCAQQALMLLPQEDKSRRAFALFQLACALRGAESEGWQGAAVGHLREATALLADLGKDENRPVVFQELGECLVLQPKPNWIEAIDAFGQAADLFGKLNKNAQLAIVHHWLAFCHGKKSPPDLAKEAEHYRQVLEYLPEGQNQDRAIVLRELGDCLRRKPAPDIQGALKCYEEAANSLSDNLTECAATLREIGLCLRSGSEPDWLGAIRHYEKALGVLSSEKHPVDYAVTLRELAYCLRNQPEVKWKEAIECLERALKLLPADQGKERAITQWELDYCLDYQPEGSSHVE